MKLYAINCDGYFERPLHGLILDLRGTSQQYPKEVDDKIGKMFLDNIYIFEVKEKRVEQKVTPIIEKVKTDYSTLKRNVLYGIAKEKGYNAKYFESTNALLIEFLEKA